MDNGQSVCATVPACQFSSLLQEVKRHGGGAISNRMNSADRLEGNGDIKAAEKARNEAEVMKAIAIERGITL